MFAELSREVTEVTHNHEVKVRGRNDQCLHRDDSCGIAKAYYDVSAAIREHALTYLNERLRGILESF